MRRALVSWERVRLRQGKPWGGHLIYGYTRSEDGEQVVVYEEEAQWVREIFDWYTGDVGVREIARRLIAEGAPPKRGRTQRTRWPTSTIYRILRRDAYATGIHKVKRDGEEFGVPIPKVIEPEQFHLAQDLLRSHSQDKARNVKYRYLLRGLVTSPCDTSWHAFTHRYTAKWRKKTTDEIHTYPAKRRYYRCSRTATSVEDMHHPDCPKTKGVVRLDQGIWEVVSQQLRQPQLLTNAAHIRLEELRERHSEASSELTALQARQKEIEGARKYFVEKHATDRITGGSFTESDLDIALASLTSEDVALRQKVAEISLLAQAPFDKLETVIEDYLSNVREGLEWLDSKPEGEDEEKAQFEERRRIVEALVERVVLRKAEEPEIIFTLDLSDILNLDEFHSNRS